MRDDLAERPNALDPIDPAIRDHGALPTGENSATPDAYLGPVGRPNALGPIPPMWDPSALPAGENPLTGDPLLHGPGASSNLPFQHSPSGVTGAFPQGPPVPPVPADYPTRPLPSDSPLFPRRNAFSEPAGSVSPWEQPQSGRDGSLSLPLGTSSVPGRALSKGPRISLRRLATSSAPGRALIWRNGRTCSIPISWSFWGGT